MPPNGGLRLRRHDKVVLFAEHRACIFKPHPIKPARSSGQCTASPPPARSPTPTAPASQPPHATSSGSSLRPIRGPPAAAERAACARGQQRACPGGRELRGRDGVRRRPARRRQAQRRARARVDARRARRTSSTTWRSSRRAPQGRHRAHDPRQPGERDRPAVGHRRDDAVVPALQGQARSGARRPLSRARVVAAGHLRPHFRGVLPEEQIRVPRRARPRSTSASRSRTTRRTCSRATTPRRAASC